MDQPIDPNERYYAPLVAAFVRGTIDDAPDQQAALWRTPLEQLSGPEIARLIALGQARGLRLHKFERTMGLPRVRKVLGILKGYQPGELLDIGSGRGAFLWPLLDAFPALAVHAIDQQQRRVSDIQALGRGGLARLSASLMDARALALPDCSYDIVTMLEVLEHIPDPQRALAQVCRVARRCVILSVPSKEDSNPEHIHLFDQRRLLALFAGCGVERVKFEYVHTHLIAVATVEL